MLDISNPIFIIVFFLLLSLLEIVYGLLCHRCGFISGYKAGVSISKRKKRRRYSNHDIYDISKKFQKYKRFV